MNAIKDFTPTADQISLHGLGFIQVKLPNSARMHVWHPDLPRRSCYDFSSIHNHRFSFRSRVLIGQQINRRYRVWENQHGGHDLISHDARGARRAAACHMWRAGCRSRPGATRFMGRRQLHHAGARISLDAK